MKFPGIFTAALAGLILMSGCLAEGGSNGSEAVPSEDELNRVESAVEQYREETEVLPIQTRDAETPEFRRYPIDFQRLTAGYLSEIPGNSFERGGIFQYVIVDPEESAEVRLIDLRAANIIQELERKIHQYRSEYSYAPVKEVVDGEIVELDYEALNYDEPPTVPSPFEPNHRLPVYMKTSGELIVDYSLDIQSYKDEYDTSEYSAGDDYRQLLVENAMFVPDYSVEQTVIDGEVKFAVP
ncbi:hypothetical protein [Salisediminibacterium halotolerans]|uniref:ABC transporter periplasmic binding protein yphF n=1 Tax=Salisediminibacterium halotolerans TaxID=517425 RepID=A0A1H9P493_9BACI|nr:hypothetical protein [Salisediminibacterium haloalkalitolerans]SER42877.1 hypothetical protein SAMN05444126_10176 [Salisediminibacterium haloalkalitolerans]